MRRRYRIPPPPPDAEHIVGEMFEFKPEHDRVNAGKPLPSPVELTPLGPAPTLYEFHAEHDRIRSTSGACPETCNLVSRQQGVDAAHSTRFDDEPYVLEYLRDGPKLYWQIRHYLYLMGSETRAPATAVMLKVLADSGLVRVDPKSGAHHLSSCD